MTYRARSRRHRGNARPRQPIWSRLASSPAPPRAARPGFRRMEKITGRTDDMTIIRDVNVFPTQIEESILRMAKAAHHVDGCPADRCRRSLQAN